MTIHRFVLTTLMFTCLANVSFGQTNVRQKGIFGGIAGAAAGAAIGENNDEPLAGALIGGALGLITGSALGQAQDDSIAQNRAYANQQYQQQMRGAVSTYDVAQMVGSGLSPQIVINHIQQNGVQKRPEVNDIIWLHQQRVPEPVITAMQRASVGAPTYAARPTSTVFVEPAPVVVSPAPVVEYRYVTPRPVYRPQYRYAPPKQYHRRGGSSWGFHIGGR